MNSPLLHYILPKGVKTTPDMQLVNTAPFHTDCVSVPGKRTMPFWLEREDFSWKKILSSFSSLTLTLLNLSQSQK